MGDSSRMAQIKADEEKMEESDKPQKARSRDKKLT
jgi:hypothetical protein